MVLSPAPSRPRRGTTIRLGELLVRAGAISPEQLGAALREQAAWGGRLGQSLLSLGYLDEQLLVAALASQLALPRVDLDAAPPPPEVARILPLTIAERHGLIPLGPGRTPERLRVACFDPTNLAAMDGFRRATGLVPEPVLTTASQIERHLRRIYYGEETTPSLAPDPRLNVTRRALGGAKDARSLEQRLARLERGLEGLRHRKAARRGGR